MNPIVHTGHKKLLGHYFSLLENRCCKDTSVVAGLDLVQCRLTSISSKQEHMDVYLGLMLMRFVNDTCRYARSERTQETSDLHLCSTPESSERRYGNLVDSSSDELRDGVQRRSYSIKGLHIPYTKNQLSPRSWLSRLLSNHRKVLRPYFHNSMKLKPTT